MTPDKQILLFLTMVLWNKPHYQSLVQIWGVTKDMTAEKTQKMLLEDEQRLKANSGASSLVIRGHSHQNIEAANGWYCDKLKHKKDSC